MSGWRTGVARIPAWASPEAPIMQFDRSGKLLKSFGANMFAIPHGILVDNDGNIWVTDTGMLPGGKPEGKGFQVIKFSPEGKVLMTLGKSGVSVATPGAFLSPTSVFIAPSGDIFVTDGHTSAPEERVVRFSRDGKFIASYGKHGTGPGEYNMPHAMAQDSQGRIFIADLANNASRSSTRPSNSSQSGDNSAARIISSSGTTSST